MSALADILRQNRILECIELYDNKITDKGIETISTYLIGNTTLKSLDLSYNIGITDKSSSHFIEAALKSCLISIKLAETSVSEENQEEINKKLSINVQEREIPVHSPTKSAAKSYQPYI